MKRSKKKPAGTIPQGVDLVVHRQGIEWIFRALTEAARSWLAKRVDARPEQWVGHALILDYPGGRRLLIESQGDGLKVDIQ